MKFTIITILVFSALFFFVACKSKKVISPTGLGNPVMTLSKSSCFGKCKVYELKIYEDKTVSFKGIDNVENIGMFYSVITKDEFQSLTQLFEAANFQNLESTYLTGIRDKQKMTLGFSQKEVKYQNRAASEELKAITKKMEVLIEKMKWKKN